MRAVVAGDGTGSGAAIPLDALMVAGRVERPRAPLPPLVATSDAQLTLALDLSLPLAQLLDEARRLLADAGIVGDAAEAVRDDVRRARFQHLLRPAD